MCRMLALLTKNDFDKNIFTEFFSIAKNGAVKPNHTEGHLDGWGIAGFLATHPIIFEKSKFRVLSEKKLYEKTIDKVMLSNSKFTIVHFRKASSGNISLENTHPFLHGEWIFAHNGTVLEKDKLPIIYNFCNGTTDSKLLFNFIIENIGLNINFIPKLVDIIKFFKFNFKHTSLTFFLMNSDYFVVYREHSTKFAESGGCPYWNKYYYTMYYLKKDGYIAFCSQPLKNSQQWIPLKNSQLIAINRNLHIEYDEKI
ncbi:MAG: class II glutamine amidotransferase [Endomicrobiia bacterium]